MDYVNLPLYDDISYYKYSMALEKQSYRLMFTYNEKMQRYTLSLFSSDDELMVAGVLLTPNYPIMANLVLDDNLTGSFLMLPKDGSTKEYYKLYPRNLSEYYYFYYVYSDTTV